MISKLDSKSTDSFLIHVPERSDANTIKASQLDSPFAIVH